MNAYMLKQDFSIGIKLQVHRYWQLVSTLPFSTNAPVLLSSDVNLQYYPFKCERVYT